VAEEQLTFVEGCSILDNALIAIEVIHVRKRKTRGVKGDLCSKSTYLGLPSMVGRSKKATFCICQR
jgi:hypothetical protein